MPLSLLIYKIALVVIVACFVLLLDFLCEDVFKDKLKPIQNMINMATGAVIIYGLMGIFTLIYRYLQ